MTCFLTRGAVATSLLLLALFVHGCFHPPPDTGQDAQAMLDRAVEYLWAMQHDDGGWHSSTYALLKSGQALTPFILSTLLHLPDNETSTTDERVAHAAAFIRRHINENGVSGLANPLILEYPNYATSYALRVLTALNVAADSALIQQMRSYLLDQQFDESRDIDAAHPAFGGWGFGETELAAGRAGHVDISHTRRVLQALRQSGIENGEVYRRASGFLSNIQSKSGAGAEYIDGGFYYSPVIAAANKGGVTETENQTVYDSYASATCDGLLAYLAAGRPLDDPLVQQAVQWLTAHTLLSYPEGIPSEHPARWRDALFFYHLAVRAETYHRIGWPQGAREAVVSLLSERMRQDGSFVNPLGGPNKENDPLLATALAVQALGYVSVRGPGS